MKKLLLVLAIGAFVACNESATEDSAPVSDTPATVDQNTTVAPDSSATSAPGVDSTAKLSDSSGSN